MNFKQAIIHLSKLLNLIFIKSLGKLRFGGTHPKFSASKLSAIDHQCIGFQSLIRNEEKLQVIWLCGPFVPKFMSETCFLKR